MVSILQRTLELSREKVHAPAVLLAPVRALHFDPVFRAPRLVRPIPTLRDDTFHTALGARVQELQRVIKLRRVADERRLHALHKSGKFLAPL